MIEATLEPLHPFPNWVLNHDLNVHSVLFDPKLPHYVLKTKKMLGSSFSKNSKIVKFPMKISFYRLDFEKLFRILDLLNKLYLGKGLNFIVSLKVRV